MRNRNRTKIALVANATWTIYNFRLNLIKALIRQGIQVIVIAPVDEYIQYLDKIEGIRHIPLRHLSRDSTNPIQDLKLLFELFMIYRRIRPDLILHYTIKPNIFGNLAALFNRIKSISVVTGLGYTFLREGWMKKLTMWLYKVSFRFASTVVFLNPDDQNLFVKNKIIKAEKGTTILGSGVDTQKFKPGPALKQEKTVFTFIGRLLYDKGIEEFVNAAIQVRNNYPDAEFWIIGEMDDKNPSYLPKAKLVRWIEEKYIRYFGTTQDILSYITKSSCIVLPSYREGLSKVLIESAAAGKPIITTDIPGCRQVVDNGKNGLLVPVKDSNALAIAMEHFCQLPAKDKRSMGIHSRKMALEKFDDNIIIKEYFKVIQQVSGLKLQSQPKKKHLI